MARILIIEDEALVALELQLTLEDMGHEVVGTAAEVATALRIAHDAGVDLALVDIHLSDGATGVELGRQLGEGMGVTVLFMTANPGMVGGGIGGAVGVISKPTDEHGVERAVDYALRRRTGEAAPAVPPQVRAFN
ncbi:response regulator [Brevundimonas faecalis]|uniref:response regulator n=1 Tax=Brevundimonas faecalis TaxID=947378 RepID=UPI00361582FD